MQDDNSWDLQDGATQDDEVRDVYAHQEFEDESHAEDGAATQEALEAERDERDAAVSEGDAVDPSKLGMLDLAWWQEDAGQPAFQIAAELTLDLEGYSRTIESFYEHGLDKETLMASIELNMLSGGLVVGALQVLGTLTPSLRSQITEVLADLMEVMPDASEEEVAAIKAIQQVIRDERETAFRESLGHFEFEDAVGGPDGDDVPSPEFDASSN